MIGIIVNIPLKINRFLGQSLRIRVTQEEFGTLCPIKTLVKRLLPSLSTCSERISTPHRSLRESTGTEKEERVPPYVTGPEVGKGEVGRPRPLGEGEAGVEDGYPRGGVEAGDG